MAMVGESLRGSDGARLPLLLQGYFSDRSGSLDALLAVAEGALRRHCKQQPTGSRAHHPTWVFKVGGAGVSPGKRGPTGRQHHEQLLDAWEMTHALCLRMGLTDVEAVQARHRKLAQDASTNAG